MLKKLMKMLEEKETSRAKLMAEMAKTEDPEMRASQLEIINSIEEEMKKINDLIAEVKAAAGGDPADDKKDDKQDDKKDDPADDKKDDPADDKKDEPQDDEELKKRAQLFPIGDLSMVMMRGAEMSKEFEKRAQAFAKDGKMHIPGAEARSILLSTGSLAKPTKVSGINDAENTVSSIIDQVQVDDATGMGEDRVAYVKSIQTAGMATDGTASTPSDPEFRTAAIKPFLVDTLSYVSREIRKQTPLNYAEKVQEAAMQALRTKVAKLIIGGNGSTEPYGIINAVNTETSPEAIYETLTVDTNVIGEKTLRKIVFSYGGNENVGGGAVLYLNKEDLVAFGDVRGTNEKLPVYEITPDGNNPNIGIIKDGGLSVPYCISSQCTALSRSTKGSTAIKTMVYGDPRNYKLDLFGDYEVRVSEDYKFAERMLAVLGEVMVGGNIICDKGFTVVTLGANG